MGFKYFIRTIGDKHTNFSECIQRSTQRPDYEEAAVSNKSVCLFDVNVEHLAVSFVYSGIPSRYFKHDVFSRVENGRRYKDNGWQGMLIRSLMKTVDLDEAWINLQDMTLLFVAIHYTAETSSDQLSAVKALLTEQGVRFVEFKHKQIDGEQAKRQIDRVYNTL